MEKIRKLYEHMCKLEKKKESMEKLNDFGGEHYVISEKESNTYEKLKTYFDSHYNNIFKVNYAIMLKSCLEELKKIDQSWNIMVDKGKSHTFSCGRTFYGEDFYEIEDLKIRFENFSTDKKIDFYIYNANQTNVLSYNASCGKENTIYKIDLINDKNLTKHFMPNYLIKNDEQNKDILNAIKEGVWIAIKLNYIFEKQNERKSLEKKVDDFYKSISLRQGNILSYRNSIKNAENDIMKYEDEITSLNEKIKLLDKELSQNSLIDENDLVM